MGGSLRTNLDVKNSIDADGNVISRDGRLLVNWYRQLLEQVHVRDTVHLRHATRLRIDQRQAYGAVS